MHEIGASVQSAETRRVARRAEARQSRCAGGSGVDGVLAASAQCYETVAPGIADELREVFDAQLAHYAGAIGLDGLG